MSLPPASRAAPAMAAHGSFPCQLPCSLSWIGAWIGVIMRRPAHDRQGCGCSTLVTRMVRAAAAIGYAAAVRREESRHAQGFMEQAFMDTDRLPDHMLAGRRSRR